MRLVKAVVGMVALVVAPSAGAVDYATQIKPIFDANCAGCHDADKPAAGLALHDAAAIAAAEESGMLVPEDADNSEVFARLILPEDDKKLMPKGKPPLSADQIALIKEWINGSTTFVVASTGEPTPGEIMSAVPAAELPPLPSVEAASPEAIAAVEALGALVMPLYAGSNELRVSFPSNPGEVNDASVKTIAALAPALVELDLHNSAVTDAAATDLASLKHLRKLHLENTQVGDATVSAIAALPGLDYLNVYNTKVSDASIAALAGATRLKKLYVWQTAVTYAAAKDLQAKLPGLEVNLGWDHPEVVRERLMAELTRATEQAAAAEAQMTKAQADLDAAKAAKEAADAKKQAVEKQIAELAPTSGV